MKHVLCLLLLTGLVLAQDQEKKLTIGTKAGQKIPQFTAEVLDTSAKKVKKSTWDSHKTANATVYVIVSQSCPVVKKYRKRLRAITDAFAKKKVDFVFIYPMRKVALESKLAYHRQEKFGARLCNDQTMAVAKLLKIKKTPEVIFASKKGEVLFHGCIDDSPGRPKKVKKTYLKTAITEHLAGKPVTTKKSRLFG